MIAMLQMLEKYGPDPEEDNIRNDKYVLGLNKHLSGFLDVVSSAAQLVVPANKGFTKK